MHSTKVRGQIRVSTDADTQLVTEGVFDLDSYVPDALYPHYENARTQVVGWLTKLGVVRESNLNSEGVPGLCVRKQQLIICHQQLPKHERGITLL